MGIHACIHTAVTTHTTLTPTRLMPTESSRQRFQVIGHIVESDDRVRHYLKRVVTKPEDAGPAAAGSDTTIYTSKLDTIPTDTVIEVIISWERVVV